MDRVLRLPEQSTVESEQSKQEQALRFEGMIIGPLSQIPSASSRRILKDLALKIVEHPRLRGSLPREWRFKPADIKIADSHSLQNERKNEKNRINLTLAQLVQRAQRDLKFATPYLVLTKDALKLLQRAHDRGVEITIYTNSPVSSDSKIFQSAFMRAWPYILEKMPNLKLYVHGGSRLMHAKIATVDGALAVIGSYNLDMLSAFVNGEIIAVLGSENMATEANRQIQRWVDLGAPATYRYQLKRDAQGHAMHDAEGAPLVKFGPKNHVSPERLEEYARTDKLFSDRPPIPDSPREIPDHLEAFGDELSNPEKACETQGAEKEAGQCQETNSAAQKSAPRL